MSRPSDGWLERSLGLREALAIGAGTMVGAGIFVFPGLAAGRAGPAATLSFAVGAGVVLLVALLVAGVLATLSSANASILSSFRTVYALSRDRLLPGDLDRINERRRPPTWPWPPPARPSPPWCSPAGWRCWPRSPPCSTW